MTAQELRIGNLIIANGLHEGRIMTVEQIGAKGTLNDDKRVILFKEHHVGEFISECKPIPITEEWLLKFGFGKLCNRIIGKFQFNIIYNYCCEVQIGTQTIKIEFVHTLQNLYFALTGEELTIVTDAKV